jgi:hypothetical protein
MRPRGGKEAKREGGLDDQRNASEASECREHRKKLRWLRS